MTAVTPAGGTQRVALDAGQLQIALDRIWFDPIGPALQIFLPHLVDDDLPRPLDPFGHDWIVDGLCLGRTRRDTNSITACIVESVNRDRTHAGQSAVSGTSHIH